MKRLGGGIPLLVILLGASAGCARPTAGAARAGSSAPEAVAGSGADKKITDKPGSLRDEMDSSAMPELPAGVSAAGPPFRASRRDGGRGAVSVTLPYSTPPAAVGGFTRPGDWQTFPISSIDTEHRTVTVYITTAALLLPIYFPGGFPDVETDFDPATDAFPSIADSSERSPLPTGFDRGEVVFARWYRKAVGSGLKQVSDIAKPAAHESYSRLTDPLSDELNDFCSASSASVGQLAVSDGRALLAELMLTHRPVTLGLFVNSSGRPDSVTEGPSVLVYGFSRGSFLVYDPLAAEPATIEVGDSGQLRPYTIGSDKYTRYWMLGSLLPDSVTEPIMKRVYDEARRSPSDGSAPSKPRAQSSSDWWKPAVKLGEPDEDAASLVARAYPPLADGSPVAGKIVLLPDESSSAGGLQSYVVSCADRDEEILVRTEFIFNPDVRADAPAADRRAGGHYEIASVSSRVEGDHRWARIWPQPGPSFEAKESRQEAVDLSHLR